MLNVVRCRPCTLPDVVSMLQVVDQTKIAFQDLIVGFHSAIFPLAKDCSEEDPWHKKTFT